MKYIYYILAIIIISSVGIAYSTHEKFSANDDYAVIINDKVISPSEFKKRYDQSKEYLDRGEFINSIIMKELFIQEAKKIGIDRDESFRQSIQNYYEQSLTKILLDRKFNELTVNVRDEEIDRCLDLSGRKISITLKIHSITNEKDDVETKLVDIFDNFSSEIKLSLLPMAVGEEVKVRMNQDEVVIHLDSVGLKAEPISMALQRDEAAKFIGEYKREEAIKAWMDGLREKSSVTINKSKTL